MKRFIKLLCVFALALSLSLPTSAFENDDTSVFISNVESFIQNSVIPFDDVFNISSNANLMLGNEIPAYFLNDGTTFVAASVHYFPIFSDSSVIGLLQVYNDQNNKQTFYYSESYADQINSFIEKYEAIALLGDGHSLTLLSQSAVTCLSPANIKTCSSIEVPSHITYESPVEKLYPLNITAQKTTKAPIGYNIAVPKKKQEGTWDCWAACVASVGQYMTGTSYSPSTVARKAGISTTANMNQTQGALDDIFSVSSTYYDGSPNAQTLINYICDDRPLLGGFMREDFNIGHMMVICGYGSSSSNFSIIVMNPTDGQYATMSTSIDHPITIPLGGTSYYLSEYLLV